ncbi:glycosyltransferase 87 family protein [Flexivirga lutea]
MEGTARAPSDSDAVHALIVEDDTAPSVAPPRRRVRVGPIAVFALALVLRLGVVLRKGGFHGIIGYDCGVYFAGSDALLHGRLPYRDFTMVHPPAITLVLTPFAALTRLMTDWHAFIVATLFFCLLGAANAVLVVLLCRRLGMARRGALVAGLFYAAWFGSVIAEFEVKLEPLGNFFLLLGLLALLRDQRRPGRWSAVLAGAVIGLPLTVKIWWVVPVLLIIVWHGHCRRSVRPAVHALLGAAAAVTAVCLPFFLADPAAMWQSVITGQLGRPRTSPIIGRLAEMTTVPVLLHTSSTARTVLAIVAVAVLALTGALAWRGSRRARWLVVVTLAQVLVLLAAPSWFPYYNDYPAVGLAVTMGAAAVAIRGEQWVRVPASLVTATTAVVSALITITGASAIPAYAGAAQLARAVRHERCVSSNNATVLLRLGVLSKDLAAGCPEWIDVGGRVMGPDDPAALRARGRSWQDVELRYLRSADAVVLWPDDPRYLAQVRHGLAQDGTILTVDGHTIYRGRPLG